VTAAGGPEWPEPPVPEGVQPPNHPQIANTNVDVIRHGFMRLSYFRFFRSGKVRINLSGRWNLPQSGRLPVRSATRAEGERR
jgi:hypothetical protein